MLVLTRKAGQNIRIGDEIIVSVVRTNRGRVRLGIDAPQNVSVRREELPARNTHWVDEKARHCGSIHAQPIAASCTLRSLNMNQTISHDVAEKVKHEHAALRDKLRQIHDVLAGREIASDEIVILLEEFQSALAVHFSNEEESEGFFESVTAHSPRLSHQAGLLCVEHKELMRKATELCRFAAAGCPSMPWWRELSSRCHAFSRELMQHENKESKLLQQAYQDDLGGGSD
jgi:carbon storage regulator